MKKNNTQPSAGARFGISGAALLCALAISSMYQLQAQTALQCNQSAQTISYNGSYQDFVLSSNAARITFTVKGGDGGKARVRYADCCLIDNVCNTDGGVGATVTATFAVRADASNSHD